MIEVGFIRTFIYEKLSLMEFSSLSRSVGFILALTSSTFVLGQANYQQVVNSTAVGNKVFLEVNAVNLQQSIDSIFSALTPENLGGSNDWSDVLDNGNNPGMDVNFSSYDAYGIGDLTASGTVAADSLVLAKDATIAGRLSVTGVTTIGDNLSVEGFVSLGDSVEVVKTVSIGESLFVTGVTSLGDSMFVAGNVNLNQLLNVVGAATFQSTLSVQGATSLNSSLSVTGLTTMSDSLHVTGGADFDSNVNVDGNGAIGGTLRADSIVVTDVIQGAVSSIANHTTDGLSEGESNLYFTTERAQDAVSVDLDSLYGLVDDLRVDMDSLHAGTCTTINYNGYDYDLVEIGGECWFAENLQTTRYQDGTDIASVSMANCGIGVELCFGDNDNFDDAHYSDFFTDGLVYTWFAVANTDNGGLCPSGYRVASSADWEALHANYDYDASSGWDLVSPPAPGLNTDGFNATLAGYVIEDPLYSWDPDALYYGDGGAKHVEYGESGGWWTMAQVNATEATAHRVTKADATATWASETFDKFAGFPVRCVAGTETLVTNLVADTLTASHVGVMSDSLYVGGNSNLVGDVNFGSNVAVSGQTTLSDSLIVNSGIRIADGTEGDGKLLISDANGNATWQAAPEQVTYTGGTGVTVSAGEISIGQAVGTTDDVTFNQVLVDSITSSGAIVANGHLLVNDSTRIAGHLNVAGQLTVSDSVTISGGLNVENAAGLLTVGASPYMSGFSGVTSYSQVNHRAGQLNLNEQVVSSSLSTVSKLDLVGLDTFGPLGGTAEDLMYLNVQSFAVLGPHAFMTYDNLNSIAAAGHVVTTDKTFMGEPGDEGVVDLTWSRDSIVFITNQLILDADSTQLGGDLLVAGETHLADSLHVGSGVNVNGSLAVTGMATFEDSLAVAGGMHVGGSLYAAAMQVGDHNMDSIFLMMDELRDDVNTIISASSSSSSSSSVQGCTGSSVTYNGYDYALVEVGGQCWFAENLQTTSYQDGTPIATPDFDCGFGAEICFGDNDSYDDAHFISGYDNEMMYTWFAVTNTANGGLCPTGYRVSTEADWEALHTNYDYASSLGWDLVSETYTNGLNTDGFNAKLHGYVEENPDYSWDPDAIFYGDGEAKWREEGVSAGWWTLAEVDATQGTAYRMTQTGDPFDPIPTASWAAEPFDKFKGLPIRCVYGSEFPSSSSTSTTESTSADTLTATLVGVMSDSLYVGGNANLVGDVNIGSSLVVNDTNVLAIIASLQAQIDALSGGGSSTPCADETTYTYHETTYNLVELGSDCWFADDLETTNLNSGIALFQSQGYLFSPNPWDPGYVYQVVVQSGGNRYNYGALVSDALCPKGWHVPTVDDVNNASQDANFSSSFSSGGYAWDTDYNAGMSGGWAIATAPSVGGVTVFGSTGAMFPQSSEYAGATTRCVKD